MTREISLHQHPIIEPGVCAKCGTQHSSWFVDLGFDSVFNYEDDSGYKTWTDGIVYLCADCTNSFFSDLFRAYNIYQREELRNLDPLKMIPITLDKKADDNGDSGLGSGVDSGDSEDVGEESGDSGGDFAGEQPAFRVSLAEAV